MMTGTRHKLCERVGNVFVEKLAALKRGLPVILLLAFFAAVIAHRVTHFRPWDVDLAEAPLRVESGR